MHDILKALASKPPQKIVLASHSAGVEETQAAIKMVRDFFRWARRECQKHGTIRQGWNPLDRSLLSSQSFYKSVNFSYSVPDLKKQMHYTKEFDAYCEMAKNYDAGESGDENKPKFIKDWIILDKSHITSGFKMKVDHSMVGSTIVISSNNTAGLGGQPVTNIFKSKKQRYPAQIVDQYGKKIFAQPVGMNDLASRNMNGIDHYDVECGHFSVDRAFYRKNEKDDNCYEGNHHWFLQRLAQIEKEACKEKGYMYAEPMRQVEILYENRFTQQNSHSPTKL